MDNNIPTLAKFWLYYIIIIILHFYTQGVTTLTLGL
jgi:hypothetical protein